MRALVTGASRGIGRFVAKSLADRGYDVVAVARDASRLSDLAKASSGRVVPVAQDLGTASGRDAVIRAAQASAIPFDAVVLAAGLVHYAPTLTVGDESLARQLTVNFESAFALMRDLSPWLTNGGAMVVVASTLAEAVAPDTAAYAASKAALVSSVKSFALALGARGIRVNAVSPGIVETDMVRERIATHRNELLALHPLGRFATVSEVADAVCYLIDAPWVTATNLVVDAGLSLRS